MKSYKKAIISMLAIMMLVPLSACVRTDYGIEIGAGNNPSLAYYANTTEENYLKNNKYSREDYMQQIESDAEGQGYSSWDFNAVDILDASGNHYIGGRYQKTIKKDEIEKYIEELIGDVADINYTDTNLFGKRTISVTIRPNGGTWNDRLYSAAGSAKDSSKYFDYYFNLTAPSEIVETNGTIKADGRTVEWNIEPIIYGESNFLSMQITFMDYYFLKYVIIAGIVLLLIIGVAVFFIVKKIKDNKEYKDAGNLRIG